MLIQTWRASSTRALDSDCSGQTSDSVIAFGPSRRTRKSRSNRRIRLMVRFRAGAVFAEFMADSFSYGLEGTSRLTRSQTTETEFTATLITDGQRVVQGGSSWRDECRT